jgi:serine/threonine protein kinase
VLEEPAFAGGDATLFYFGAEPIVVVHRAGQQVECNLVDRATALSRQARKPRFEFGRNLQVHEASVGALEEAVNLSDSNVPLLLAGAPKPDVPFTTPPHHSPRSALRDGLRKGNIGQIHGFEESDGVKALVMELVEGPTLAGRIAQGPIPLDKALPIAKQIAEALEAAH